MTAYDQIVPDERSEEAAALVALLRTRPEGLNWTEIAARVAEDGSARTVWERHRPLTLVPDATDPIADAATSLVEWERAGRYFVTIVEDEYPAQLRDIHQAPPILFFDGRLVGADVAVSVVGTRRPTERGLSIARAVSSGLVEREVSVVSGLARGIDSAALVETLDRGGRAVAVLGTGITQVYPAENRALQESIGDRGLVLSQFWPDAPPQKHTFLMRNATMSGYGMATIVIEAGETSGSRAQARMAVEHGRPVILTDLVIAANEWARALLGRPGVHAVSSTADVMAVVEGLIRERRQIGELLRHVSMS